VDVCRVRESQFVVQELSQTSIDYYPQYIQQAVSLIHSTVTCNLTCSLLLYRNNAPSHQLQRYDRFIINISDKQMKTFLLLVVTTYFINGLYATSDMDDFDHGLRSALQSQEVHLESDSDQAWMCGSSAYMSTTEQTPNLVLPTLPCFRDSQMENMDYIDVTFLPHCADAKNIFEPCPDSAYCAGGALKHCDYDGRYFEVSSNGDQCVLTAASNATVQQLIDTLHEWTIQDHCFNKGCVYTVKHLSEDDAGHPLFRLVCDLKLLELANVARYAETGKYVFFIMHENDNYLIGLHPDQQVLRPHECNLKRDVKRFLIPKVIWAYFTFRAVFATLLDFTADLVMGVYFIFTAVFTTLSDFLVDLFPPIVSALAVLVGLTGFFLVKVIRGRQLQKEELLLDIVVCRGRVWDILARDFREEHQSVHIRDQICLQIYPISQSGRKYIQSTVWPRVVGDIRQDTRIRKRDVAVAAAAGGGAVEMREYWQWVAVPRHV
jgi:hypothetical protein